MTTVDESAPQNTIPMNEPLFRRCGKWNVELRLVHDVIKPRWKANAAYYFDSQWSEDEDASVAISNLAALVGENKDDWLREFGLA